MPRYMCLLQLTFLVLLQGLLTVKCENERKSVELENSSFLIDPNGKYTWKEAEVECKKEHATLLSPLGTYDYKPLHNYIKHNFENHSSFWTNNQVKVSSFFASIGLQNHKMSEKKCLYFEGITFKYRPDACDKTLGFICEKPLKEGLLSFRGANKIYITQTDKEYTCQQAHTKCGDLQMTLLTYDEFVNNTVLLNNINTHYGTTPRFWLGDNDNSAYNCAASHRNEKLNFRTKFGFICEKSVNDAGMSNRHLILIILVAVLAVVGLIVLCAMKFYVRKVKSDAYVTDIPEPLKKNFVMSI